MSCIYITILLTIAISTITVIVNNLVSIKLDHVVRTDKCLQFVAKKPYRRSQYSSSFMKLLRLSIIIIIIIKIIATICFKAG